jgi:hypothetical protein
MTTDDVMREFIRSVPYIDGVAESHYVDAHAMAAEIVRLRACVERVRGIVSLQNAITYQTVGQYRTALLAALEDA